MPWRFPLYAKILCWFFVNVLLLAVVFYLLCRGQFRLGLDGMLSERIEAEGDIILAALADEPQPNWSAILQRYGEAHRQKVTFLVFSGDGHQLAGEPMDLPAEVRGQWGRRREPPGDRPWEPRAGPPPVPPRRFIHTSNPSRYWVLKRGLFHPPEEGRPAPVILIAVSPSFTGDGLFFDLTPWLAIGAGAIVFSGLLWFPLVRDMSRSIAQMTTAANQIAQGHFDIRVNDRRRDELGALGQSINQMASRLNDLVNGQKRFLGDVAHELCSPLAKLRVSLGILEQQGTEEQKGYLAGAEEEAAYMAELVNELLSFSKAALGGSPPQVRAVLLSEVVQRAIRRDASPPAQVNVSVPQQMRVLADPELLTRSLSNLLRNAVRYAGTSGPISLTARQEGQLAVVSVADSGPGVPETELARIFDPFYRVDRSRDRATGGAGLGLAIVKTCVESCGGTVSGHNRTPSGLEVIIRLPLAENGSVAETTT
jgi:two-component system sensor histidine kinase CpxA